MKDILINNLIRIIIVAVGLSILFYFLFRLDNFNEYTKTEYTVNDLVVYEKHYDDDIACTTEFYETLVYQDDEYEYYSILSSSCPVYYVIIDDNYVSLFSYTNNNKDVLFPNSIEELEWYLYKEEK